MVQLKTMLELKEYDLKDFIDWDAEKLHSTSILNNWHVFALAYGMVSFLMQNEETMIAVINHIYKGKSSYEALDNAYKGGFATFEKEFVQSVGELKTLKINTNFAYSLPVKPGDSIRSALQKNSVGFTLIFDPPYGYVKQGEPIAVNTGEKAPKALGLAVYYIDENKVQIPWIGYKCSHIVPVFQTLNKGNVKLERGVTYY